MTFGKSNSLTHKLLIGTTMMVGFTLLLSISIIASFYETYRRSEENLAALTWYRQVLVAANVLSAERGPSNAVLARSPQPTARRASVLPSFASNPMPRSIP